jgi:hypothetical protein
MSDRAGAFGDPARAAELLTRAADADDVDGITALGHLCLHGRGVAQDLDRAESLFRRAAERGHAPALVQLGQILAARGEAAEAARCYQTAAESGDLDAQLHLVQVYRRGDGVARDDEMAAVWLRKAAEQGHPGAQFRLGAMFCIGQGVRRDLVEGVKWYRRAAEQGERVAQFNLAVMLGKGEGIDADLEEAFRWCQRAAEREMPEAEMLLGDLFATGRGTTVDVDAARTWYMRAAEHGLTAARAKLTRLPPGLTSAPH